MFFPSFNNSNNLDNYAIFTLLFNAKVFTKFQQNTVIINRERARMRQHPRPIFYSSRFTDKEHCSQSISGVVVQVIRTNRKYRQFPRKSKVFHFRPNSSEHTTHYRYQDITANRFLCFRFQPCPHYTVVGAFCQLFKF